MRGLGARCALGRRPSRACGAVAAAVPGKGAAGRGGARAARAARGVTSRWESTAWEAQEECRGHAVAQAERHQRDSRLGGGTLCDECVRHGVEGKAQGRRFLSVRRRAAHATLHMRWAVTEFW